MLAFLHKRTLLILIAIVVLAGLLRAVNISSVPPSLYWDEVSQGYNAYSIAKTGRDEHGEFLPIARFQAFGDYKAPVYIYLDVPFIALLGKTTLAVRLPSVIFGTLTVLFAFLVAYELFHKTDQRDTLALLTALFLAISPWHIQLSRAAYEGNVATFFTVVGVYFFLLAVRKLPWMMIISSISFVLGFYAFNAQRVFIPLLVVFLALVFFKRLFTMKKYVVISLIIGLVMMAPFLVYLKTPESRLRFNEVNIFSDLSVIEQSNKLIQQEGSSVIAKLVHNRRVAFGQLYLEHYFDFFNPVYLFFTGDVNTRFSMQDSGELFLWELPLLLVGFYTLFIRRTKTTLIILGWFLLAPVAAATARETPHALRSETFIPTYEMIAALGLTELLEYMKEYASRYFKWIAGVIGVIIAITVIFFVHDYFLHFPTNYSQDWQYGYKQTVQDVEKIKKNYDYVAFSRIYGRPYIYVLFYSNIPPQKYPAIADVRQDILGFYNVYQVGKYYFRNQLIQPEDAGKKVLYVGSPKEIPANFHILRTEYFMNGKPAFEIATP